MRRKPEDPIADVEFRVWFDGGHWCAQSNVYAAGKREGVGEGTTPVTAMMVAEALARKAALKP